MCSITNFFLLRKLCNSCYCNIDSRDFIPGFVIYLPCHRKTENTLKGFDCIPCFTSVYSIYFY